MPRTVIATGATAGVGRSGRPPLRGRPRPDRPTPISDGTRSPRSAIPTAILRCWSGTRRLAQPLEPSLERPTVGASRRPLASHPRRSTRSNQIRAHSSCKGTMRSMVEGASATRPWELPPFAKRRRRRGNGQAPCRTSGNGLHGARDGGTPSIRAPLSGCSRLTTPRRRLRRDLGLDFRRFQTAPHC